MTKWGLIRFHSIYGLKVISILRENDGSSRCIVNLWFWVFFGWLEGDFWRFKGFFVVWPIWLQTKPKIIKWSSWVTHARVLLYRKNKSWYALPSNSFNILQTTWAMLDLFVSGTPTGEPFRGILRVRNRLALSIFLYLKALTFLHSSAWNFC